jgi:hypothetical protein
MELRGEDCRELITPDGPLIEANEREELGVRRPLYAFVMVANGEGSWGSGVAAVDRVAGDVLGES